MRNHNDVQLTEYENQLLHEEKFELGYRLGLAEGLSAALEAISELQGLEKNTTIDKKIIKKLRSLQSSRPPLCE